MAQWTLSPEDAGVRLDKYLAAADRAGSRARAAAALERGKVFLNEREVSLADAATRLSAGDIVRLWADRPGSEAAADARRRPPPARRREDEALIVLDKPPGLLAVPRRCGGASRRRCSRI
jgi:23S rRNA pseudouridine1911/1915/1917 synthase